MLSLLVLVYVLFTGKVSGETEGRLGTWFYKIGTVSRSPEATCITWFLRNLNYHSVRQLFFSKLPQCPCSHRDVWQKTRYLWVRARVDNIRKFECYRMNRASSNRFYPVGKECCYSLDSADTNYKQLIISPPNAGSALAYNPSYMHLRGYYQMEDKLAHDTCCDIHLSDTAHCNLYYMLRPVGSCRADYPFTFTWIFGDPHIITPDEREYTFNGWGEYTLITLNSGDSDFVLQGRTSPTERETDGSLAKATVFRAFGAEENGTRVFVQLDPNTNNSLIIYGDGTDYTRRFQEEGDDFLVDEDHFTLMRDNGSLAVIFPSEIVFSVSIGWKSLVLGVFVPEKFRNQTRGLLGNYNTIKTDDFVLPDGTVLNDTLTDRQIHYQFGNAWSVTEANSVLRYGPKEGYSDYAHSEFTPIFFEEISASDKQAAENVCGAADRACIYDFVVSGSEGFALKTKECRKEALEENAASQNRLPTLEVPDNVTVTVNVPKTFRVSAYDPGDTVTYKLTNDGNGSIQIIETTGNITVTVNSNTPVTLKVFAVDSSEAQSVVYTIPLIVCFGCSSHGQCDFTRVQPAVGNLNFQHAACDCSTGWAGANCSKDYDACSSSPCHPMQTCTDQTPAQQASSSVGYTCSVCPAGYKSPAGQANLCLDVDECADDALNACEVTCNNTAGSYQCSCPDGYRLTSNLRSCVDVNECVEKSHNCKHICNNTDSGYSCLCEEGFDLESSGECVQSTATQNICSNSGCSQGCKAVEGPTTSSMVASCFCRSGYDLDPTNKKTCTDHDECKDNLCSHKCSNSQGGFTCSCYNGFQLNSDQRTCSPCPSLQYGSECAHTCLCNGRGLDCHSVTGCVCKEGWTGSQCQDDVNECEENPDVCGEVQVCTNTNGSYTCACQDGYSIDDDGVCQDVNECSNNTACGAHQVCRNVPGTFQCPCFSGYMNDKGTCKDIDECSLGSDNCQQKCVNVVGSYNCECNYYGYRLNTDRATCSQVYEPCAEVENLSCDHGCTQDDTDIAVCFCRSGYTLNSDKQTCQDVNECQDVSKKCSHTCINTAGGFTCSCPSGMVLANDGKTCVSCPAGTYGADCSMNCSCGVGTSRCDAVTGCLCKTGWTGDKCQHDVNECDLNSTRQLCEVSGAECVNLKGGYKCRCPTGYTEDNSGVCQDIDECETSPCRQVCENSAGSYRCLCDAGFTLNSTTGECTSRLGTWFYKIGTVSRSPEATCITWFLRNLNYHSVRQLFFSKLPQCPCSHRDVWQKTRYLWVRARVDNIRKFECYRINRASSNRFYPVGKECCYSLDSADPNYKQLIISPPNAGSALAYNPSYMHLRGYYQMEDKLAHDTCCDIHLSDTAHCNFYYMLRPVGSCRADYPFTITWIFGDPHIITPDEREYTFNGWGEYTLITLNSGDSDFVLQGRTSPAERETDGSPAKATVFRAFGAEENGTRVFVQLDPNTNNSLIIYGDGTDYTRRFQEEGDDFLVDEDHFTLMRDNGSLAVIFPSEIVFSVSIGWKSLVLGVFVPEKFRNQTRGLLGNYNTIKTDDFVLPDGTVLSDTLTDRQIHYQFGNAWSVTEANSVLRYGPKEGYSDYAHSEFTPIFFEEISASDKQAAENVCGAADRACIYDFVVSGSEGFALKTKECRKEALEENAASQNRLPTLEVPDNVTVTVNVPKTFRVSAYDPGDTVTYKLTNDGNGSIQIIETTGNITVTVNSNTPVTLKVFAVDSSEAQSVVYTIPLIVCFGCSSHGQCDFTRVQPAVGNRNFLHAACDCSTALPSDVAPAQPSDVASAQPSDVAPALPSDVAPALPSDVAPALPSDVAPALPSDVAPALPADVAPAQPSDVASAQPSDVAPALPSDVSPALPSDVAPAQPSDVAPALPSDVAPALPSDVAPALPFDALSPSSNGNDSDTDHP
ncbi:hypothetical protein V1264_008221 [Littorina saxatilis]|uniref:Uncharacterized protein n=1 Tax=Littorina saxatilis TaxID=31220 RepID=A0AAN9ASJ9_9CAEN